MVIYVDDLLIRGQIRNINAFIRQLAERFTINPPAYLSDNSPIDFIGMDIYRKNDTIYLSMSRYISKTLKSLGFQDYKPRSSPITSAIALDTPLDQAQIKLYRQGVGSLGWLASTGRPDVAFVFSRLGQHLQEPTQSALKTLHQAMQYLQGSKNLCLKANLQTTSENKVLCYSDSDHAGNKETQNHRCSQTGGILTLNGTPVSWRSSKQPVTSLSSTEAEIYAASTCVQQFIHIHYLMDELGVPGSRCPSVSS